MRQDPAGLDLRFLALTGGVVLISTMSAFVILFLPVLWEEPGGAEGLRTWGVLFMLSLSLGALIWGVMLLPNAVLWWGMRRWAMQQGERAVRPPYAAAAAVALLGTGGALAFLVALGIRLEAALVLTGYGLVPLGAALLLTRWLYRRDAKGVGE